MHFSIDRTVHTTAFDKPVVDHWLERKIAQTAAGSTEKDRSDDRPLQMRARYRLSYIPLPIYINIPSKRKLMHFRQKAYMNIIIFLQASLIMVILMILVMMMEMMMILMEGRKKRNVLFNTALNLFYIWLYYFIYGYMVSNI